MKATRIWKVLVAVCTMLALAMGQTAKATEVTVGSLDAATANSYLPMNSFYNYSYTQQIYTASDIGTAGTISAISVWMYGNSNLYEMPFDIYLVHTAKESFSSKSDWIPVTASDMVYSGSVTVHNTSAEAYTFTLDTPFAYNGTDNLAVCFNNKTGQWKSGLNGKVATLGEGMYSLYAYNDNAAFDPYTISSSAQGTSARNVITFNFTSTSGMIAPGNLTANLVDPTTATLTWTERGTATQWKLQYGTDSSFATYTEMTVSGTPSATLTGLTLGQTYYVRVKAISGGDESGWSSKVTFQAIVFTPENLTATPLDASSATLTWTEKGTATQWKLQYGTDEAFSAGTYTEMTVSDTPSATLTGLTLGQTYYARVKAISGGYESEWSSKVTFRPVLPIGSGTNTYQYLPTNSRAGYSLSQQIYTAAEIDMAGTINSIALYNNSTSLSRNFSIYLVHTDKTSFTSNSDWITVSASDKVFSGSVRMTSGVWTTITFDTPFTYNGTSNLALIVDDNTGQAPADMTWRVYTATGKALYKYADDTNFDPTNPPVGEGSVVNYKNQIRLGFSSIFTLLKPSSLVASDITTGTATLTWSGGSGIYNVEKKMEGEDEWTRIATNTTQTSMLIGVDENAEYQARVQSVSPSDATVVSAWVTTTFHSAVQFPVPTGLTATLTPGNGTVATLSWTENGTATSWELEYGTDPEFNTIIRSFTLGYQPKQLTGLTPEQTYYFRVRSVCDEGYSRWSSACSFTPTDEYRLTVNDGTTTNNVVPVYGWWADNETRSQFIIEAADLSMMTYGTIEQMTFYAPSGNISWGTAEFEVYMKEVDYTAFGIATLVDWDSMDKVMNAASLSIDSDGKMVVTLDDPYQYMGGNLLIGFKQTTSGSYVSCSWYGTTVSSAAVGGYGSSISIQDFLPKTAFNFTPGVMPSCFKPKDLKATAVTKNAATLQWTAGSTDQTVWDIAYKAEGDTDFTLIEEITSNPYTLTGLLPETEYTVKVRGNCGGGDVSEWSNEVVFTTDIAFPAPANLSATDVEPHSAVISWGSNGAKRYNLRYKKAEMSTMTTVILRTDDVWGDGTGYQMLLDANATAYDNVLPSSGPLTNSGDADASVYAEFEYKIPTNADGELTTSNIVIDESMSIVIPAGTYDWCITNPTPGDCLWIASAGGTIGGRADDYVFEPGKIYEFHVYHDSSTGNDATDLTITDDLDALAGSNEDWIVVNNVSSPYSLTGLDAQSTYVVQVQCVYDDGMSQWTSTTFATPEENPVPFNVDVTTATTSATISWNGFGDCYNVKYRKAAGPEMSFFEDFENGLDMWTIVRNGEGTAAYDWQTATTSDAVSGSTVAVSFSWDGTTAYNVDNWLISPAVTLDGTLRFWVRDYGSWHDHYDVYVSTTTNELDQFTLLSEPGNASSTWAEVTVDLSSYNGAQGYIAIRHQDRDKYYLLIDDFGIYTGAEITAGEWTTVSTTEKSLNITGLDPVTTYEYQIQSEKAGKTTSDWTALKTFMTRYQKMSGDVNDDGHIGIGDVTATVNLIKNHLYDAAADLNGDNVVDADDLEEMVNTEILHVTPQPILAVRRKMSTASKKTSLPLNLRIRSKKDGEGEKVKPQLYRTK